MRYNPLVKAWASLAAAILLLATVCAAACPDIPVPSCHPQKEDPQEKNRCLDDTAVVLEKIFTDGVTLPFVTVSIPQPDPIFSATVRSLGHIRKGDFNDRTCTDSFAQGEAGMLRQL
jgi:hypothetical protein